jgi:hypothetical protein
VLYFRWADGILRPFLLKTGSFYQLSIHATFVSHAGMVPNSFAFNSSPVWMAACCHFCARSVLVEAILMQSIEMRSIGRNLTVGFAISVLTLGFALAHGSPFVGFARAQDKEQQQKKQDQAQTGTFTGTVAKKGDQYVLHDSSGEIFALDDTERARPYEGKTVKVTGQLDEKAKSIHVETIVGAEG